MSTPERTPQRPPNRLSPPGGSKPEKPELEKPELDPGSESMADRLAFYFFMAAVLAAVVTLAVYALVL